ncbi:MAG TPA: GGDEF domain-containing protein [Permianibacter sp.]|nr:GGDEF domain-containing protein [Permianibacter sp.]
MKITFTNRPNGQAGALQKALKDARAQTACEHRKVVELARINNALFDEMREQELLFRQLQEMAYHDELTGLPNRHLLQDRYRSAVAYAERRGNQIAVLFIDINRFKSFNDEFGHAAGDRLLRVLSERLVGALRSIDTVCRYGGDEFVVLSPEVDGLESAITIAQKINMALTQPCKFGEEASATISVSIGISLYPIDGTTLSQLLLKADDLMYASKQGLATPTASRRTEH